MVSRKKPFGCSVCHLSFRLAKSLVKHVAIHNSYGSKSKIHNSNGAKSKIQEEANNSDVKSVPRNTDSILQKTQNKFSDNNEKASNKSSEYSKLSKIKVENSYFVKEFTGSKGSLQVLKPKKYMFFKPTYALFLDLRQEFFLIKKLLQKSNIFASQILVSISSVLLF